MVLRRLNASARYFSCTANILLICICRLDTECIYKLYAFITGSRSSPLTAACRVLDNISLSAALSLEAVIVMFLSIALFLLFLSPSSSSRLCSHLCRCYEHSDLVDCHARGFEDVPHGLPHGTWLLDLGGNKLREIRSRAFTGLWSLRILVLSDSSIQALQTQVRSLIPDVHNPVIYLPCKVSSSKYHLNQLFKGIVHLKNINIC